ncbi:MAG: hypothetical protein FJX76_11575 [Armatimonadetes bacterium]|nr:hypothetical protein [Armatimonadota bacterium]
MPFGRPLLYVVLLALTVLAALSWFPLVPQASPDPSLVAAVAPARGVVRVRHDDAIFRVGPGDDYDRRTPLKAGVMLAVHGRFGAWLRADLGGGDAGWVQEKDIHWERPGTRLPTAHVRNILVRPAPNNVRETYVDIQLTRRLAFEVIEEAPDRLTIRLHPAILMMHELAQFVGDPAIRSATLEQIVPGRVDLRLRLSGLWGWRASYGASARLATDPPGHDFSKVTPEVLRIAIKWPPARRDVGGLTVVVDAGHGGDDPGATGVGGLREADANLAVALAFRDLLTARGARVVMTRETDRTVAASHDAELATRVTVGKEAGGDLFISIHHNARPVIADSRVARGTYVYYYRQQSADLARALTEPLAKAAGESDRAWVWRSFHVTRQPFMPSVLVEITFISNPDMEAAMRVPDYSKRIAEGLLRGLEAFMVERAP